MVYFVCNSCQETLKLKAIDGHWCHGTYSCVDCSKDFDKATCRSHNTCITEAEKFKYATAPKGGKKVDPQELWTQQIAAAAAKAAKHKEFMSRLLGYGNVPRKAPKFINFARNSIGVRDERVLQEMFDMIVAENPRPAAGGGGAAGAAGDADAASAAPAKAAVDVAAPVKDTTGSSKTDAKATSSASSSAASESSKAAEASGKKRKRSKGSAEEAGDDEREATGAIGGAGAVASVAKPAASKSKDAKDADEAPSSKRARKFKTKDYIMTTLSAQADGRMKLKRLRKAVVERAVAEKAFDDEDDATEAFDEAIAKLQKKMKVVTDGACKFIQVVPADVAAGMSASADADNE